MATETERQLEDLRDRVARLEAALQAMFRYVDRHELADVADLDAALTAAKCAYEEAPV